MPKLFQPKAWGEDTRRPATAHNVTADLPRIKVKVISTQVCPGLSVEFSTSADGTFQRVDGYRALLYSAHLDEEEGVVRVVLLRLRTNPKGGLLCQGWYPGREGEPLEVVEGGIMDLPESHGRSFTTSLLTCPLAAKRDGSRLVAVSVVVKKCDVAPNLLFLSEVSNSTLRDFTVCVTPLNFRYSRAYELVEMIELNKVLGAQKIVFYNFSTGYNVDKALQYYTLRGDVEILPWHLPLRTDTWPPTKNPPEIHYFGQMAALNDCLYRYRASSRYIVFQDLDEFIVPKTYANWSEMVSVRQAKQPKVSAFQFRCVFFRKEWPKLAEDFEGNDVALRYNSVVLRHTLRETKILAHNVRSKFIVIPKKTKVVGIHTLWKHTGVIDKVPDSDALLHHYRSWESPNDQQPKLDDRTLVDKFGPRLVKKLAKSWEALSDIPLDVDLKSYGTSV
ncbi:glycosyltransferase family 92 protein F13G3.3 isoform X2 [Aplysia californica]|uniref:Glycosyltransferase family 92 protein n=1 Tax=Aplysia californica TaxID=6500 RepID=A0ABM1VX41_APLCA|nr:glycosyltransferase family 92 protein F13G3.3 isoform X2 [Aplysia californica]